MRATELLGRPVYDADGVCLGPVRDLRVDCGDMRSPGRCPSRFAIAGLAVGSGRLAALAHAWGYAEERAHGPWLLCRLFRQARQAARFAPATQVRSWNGERVTLACRAADLKRLTEVIDT